MSVISLPPIMDRSAVTQCLEDLRAAASCGKAIEINCQDVEQIGQAGLQLLASAVRTGRDNGFELTFTGGGGGLEATARLAGMGDILFGTPSDASGDTL
ncbi:MAG: hypothetical protein JWR77_1211 [Rhizorhabdus sp.]|nr:hypothetical protein [Rhizorhabdus sp.]